VFGSPPGDGDRHDAERRYNANYAGLTGLRHHDHRFEWDRATFARWAGQVATDYGYTVEISGIGDVDPDRGAPTQLAVFTA
jgi:hypothetical protein